MNHVQAPEKSRKDYKLTESQWGRQHVLINGANYMTKTYAYRGPKTDDPEGS